MKKTVSHSKHLFVIHKHHARTMHYDLRLEEGGVLKSWALPKGPSTDPSEKRLAIQVPDHELSYATFEGIIPQGYGAGPVLLWDSGTFESANPDSSLRDDLSKGNAHLIFHGKKIKGDYLLIRMKTGTLSGWLFIKKNDGYARPHYAITEEEPLSVVSGKTIEDLDL